MDIDRQNFLAYLKKEYPYLFEVEREVERVTMSTRYGDVSFTLKVIGGQVESGEIIGSAKFICKPRHDPKKSVWDNA